jgi:hypothetical protein
VNGRQLRMSSIYADSYKDFTNATQENPDHEQGALDENNWQIENYDFGTFFAQIINDSYNPVLEPDPEPDPTMTPEEVENWVHLANSALEVNPNDLGPKFNEPAYMQHKRKTHSTTRIYPNKIGKRYRRRRGPKIIMDLRGKDSRDANPKEGGLVKNLLKDKLLQEILSEIRMAGGSARMRIGTLNILAWEDDTGTSHGDSNHGTSNDSSSVGISEDSISEGLSYGDNQETT